MIIQYGVNTKKSPIKKDFLPKTETKTDGTLKGIIRS